MQHFDFATLIAVQSTAAIGLCLKSQFAKRRQIAPRPQTMRPFWWCCPIGAAQTRSRCCRCLLRSVPVAESWGCPLCRACQWAREFLIFDARQKGSWTRLLPAPRSNQSERQTPHARCVRYSLVGAPLREWHRPLLAPTKLHRRAKCKDCASLFADVLEAEAGPIA